MVRIPVGSYPVPTRVATRVAGPGTYCRSLSLYCKQATPAGLFHSIFKMQVLHTVILTVQWVLYLFITSTVQVRVPTQGEETIPGPNNLLFIIFSKFIKNF